MTLNPINQHNIDLALSIGKEIFPYEIRNDKLSYESAYFESINEKNPKFCYYLAYEGDSLIGITGHYPEDDGIWLGWFGVLPVCRGFGYGKKLLKNTAKIISGLGASEMLIYSGDREEERHAHRLYIESGFLQIGKGIWHGETSLFFRGPVPMKGDK